MTDLDALATILFAETKNFEDAMAIANVIKNRAMYPKRYGEGIQGVIFKPKQFSGVNSNEWNKVIKNKLTLQEKKIYNQFRNIAKDVIVNSLPDTTGGATHYFNPKLVKPKWAENMEKMYQTDYHEYYKE